MKNLKALASIAVKLYRKPATESVRYVVFGEPLGSNWRVPALVS